MRLLAYIDPGSGSFVIQLIAGSALAASLAVKVFWRRITTVFRRERADVE